MKRTRFSDEPARPTQTRSVGITHPNHELASPRRLQTFCRTISVKICLSSVRSATRCGARAPIAVAGLIRRG